MCQRICCDSCEDRYSAWPFSNYALLSAEVMCRSKSRPGVLKTYGFWASSCGLAPILDAPVVDARTAAELLNRFCRFYFATLVAYVNDTHQGINYGAFRLFDKHFQETRLQHASSLGVNVEASL